MATAFSTLPQNVQDALLEGRHEDAAELLRKARSISLKGAHAQISSVVAQGLPAVRPLQASKRPLGNAEAPATTTEAIRLGTVLAQLMSMLQHQTQSRGRFETPSEGAVEPVNSSLAPGEQPKSSLSSAIVFALAIAALAGMLVLVR
jgi:hypothetical protein